MSKPKVLQKRLTDEAILSELEARVLRHLSEQAVNTSEAEPILNKLPSERRREISEEIERRFPTPDDLGSLPPDHRKEDKDTNAERRAKRLQKP